MTEEALETGTCVFISKRLVSTWSHSDHWTRGCYHAHTPWHVCRVHVLVLLDADREEEVLVELFVQPQSVLVCSFWRVMRCPLQLWTSRLQTITRRYA